MSGLQSLPPGFFRHESARLITSLARLLGPGNIALAEDVVQDVLETALQQWVYELPDNPAAWLTRAARNRAIDIIRHRKVEQRFAEEHGTALESEWTLATTVDATMDEDSADDNMLRMMFSLCHPDLGQETHVTLILKFLCGFSAKELAQMFLTTEDTVSKRVGRGRAKLKRYGSLPPAQHDAEQIRSVANALYCLFNDYHGNQATSPMRRALCEDAMRLTRVVLEFSHDPAVTALLALMCFHYARLSGRVDADGEFVVLADQNRQLWDQTMIQTGIQLLAETSPAEASAYQFEAAIAAVHCQARSVESTDWRTITLLYDGLLKVDGSPAVVLSREIALAHSGNAAAALANIDIVGQQQKLLKYPYYWGAKAEVLLLMPGSDNDQVMAAFNRAMETARNEQERVAFARRIEALSTQ